MRRTTLLAALVVVLAAMAVPAPAATVSKDVKFELDNWVRLDAEEGPVTLHRIRLAEGGSGPIDKAKIFRPSSPEYTQTVQIQLEYTNQASRDWEVDIVFEWLDANGEVIDGYKDSENLDEGENHDMVTVTLVTSKYGIGKARRLRIRLDAVPD